MGQLLTSCWQRWRCRQHFAPTSVFISIWKKKTWKTSACLDFWCDVQNMWCISVFRCSNIIKTEKYFHCYLISGLSGRSIQLMVGALPLAGSASWSSLMFNFTNNIPVPPKFFRWCCLYPLKAFMYKSLQCGSPSLCYYLNSGFSLGSLRKTSSLIFVICVLCISPTWKFWGYNEWV